MVNVRSEARLQASLNDIRRLLDRHRVLEMLAARQEGPKRGLLEDLQHRQNVVELHRHLRSMHAADIAYVLEALPLDDRRSVWEQVTGEPAARVFVEVDPVVRESLVGVTPREAMVQLLTSLDPEDLAYVSEAVPADVLARVSGAFESADRTVFEDSKLYQDDAVGFFMTREWVAVSETPHRGARHSRPARAWRAACPDRSGLRRGRAARAHRQRAPAGAARAAARGADFRSDEP